MVGTITVLGSLNMDLVTESARVPEQGETILGDQFALLPGGKGANQAIAAARLGAKVHFIGKIGADLFGEQLLTNLEKEGVHHQWVEKVQGAATGTATILVSEADNRIIVVPGANGRITPGDVRKGEAVIAASDVLLVQLEVPMESVIEAVHLANHHGTRVILNPAPIQSLSKELVERVDFLTPNEHEYDAFKKEHPQLGPKLVVTQGNAGVTYGEIHIPSFSVRVVDTTGAGDAFNGSFAAELARGSKVEDAIRFANAAAALAVTKLGAQTGLPTRQEVTAFLESQTKRE